MARNNYAILQRKINYLEREIAKQKENKNEMKRKNLEKFIGFFVFLLICSTVFIFATKNEYFSFLFYIQKYFVVILINGLSLIGLILCLLLRFK